ncbi:hypothetical protein T439DRAFT_327882 [Meredithblackwellia eburnea MCA 4105]
MPVYSFYVFDRHCTCVYYANFSGKSPRPGPTTLPNVYRPALTIAPPPSTLGLTLPSSSSASTLGPQQRRDSLMPEAPWERNSVAGSVVVAQAGGSPGIDAPTAGDEQRDEGKGGGLAFDEEAKLVYGIILSLRNMVKKLSGKEDDTFHSFSTSAYKLHYLYTSTSTHLVLVTTPMQESLRFVLRQIYTGPYLDHVVRNPVVGMDSQVSGKGIDNDAFRIAVEKILGPL